MNKRKKGLMRSIEKHYLRTIREVCILRKKKEYKKIRGDEKYTKI